MAKPCYYRSFKTTLFNLQEILKFIFTLGRLVSEVGFKTLGQLQGTYLCDIPRPK